jgi:hypothetical protein
MSRSEAPCNSAENPVPTLSTLETWFRVVATLASGKKLTLRRRAMNSYSHVALALALTTSPKPTSGG